MFMKLWLHKIEIIVDKIIPVCLIVLLAIIVLELGFKTFVEQNHGIKIVIDVLDFIIVFVFVLDLVFKYMRVRDIPKFLRKYWLEIIAVLPFFLMFRLFEFMFGVGEISESVRLAQSMAHEGLEMEKELPIAVQEGEKVLKAERSSKLLRYIKPLLRLPRFLKTIPSMIHFYEAPFMHK